MKPKRKAADVTPGFWDRIDVRKQHGICILFLLILPVILLPEVWSGKQLAQHDIIQWRAGAESLIQYQQATGDEPFWATNMFSGMPAYVISNVQKFPSLDTLLFRFFQGIYPMAQYWILLTGAYFFFTVMGFRPLTAAFGTIIVGFTAYIPIIIGAGHNTKFHTYTWIPWLLAGFRMFTRGKHTLPGFALFLMATVLHVRGNHPQVSYYFLFLIGIWWLFELFEARKNNELRIWGIKSTAMAGVALLAVLAVIEQYIGLYEYAPYSIRGGSELAGGSGLDIGYAFVWSQGWAELLTLIIPNLFGGGELYWGPKPVTSGPHYLGGITFVLLVLSLLVHRRGLNLAFITAGILGILFSLGSHFSLLNNFMFEFFPLFNKFRTPEMWLMISVFALTVPALYALEWLADESLNGKKALKPVILTGAITLGIGIVLLTATGSWLKFEKPGERQQIAQQVAQQNQVAPNDPRVGQAVDRIMQTQFIPERRSAARGDVIRYLILTGAAVALIWLAFSGKLAASTAMLLIVLLAAFDMVGAGKRYIPDRAFGPKTADYGAVIAGMERPADTWLKNAVQTDEPWQWRVLPLADNPFNNAVPGFFYPSAGGYSGAKLSHYQDLIEKAFFTGPMGIHEGVLNMLNIRFLLTNGPFESENFRVAAELSGLYAIENQRVLQKAWFADSLIVVSSPQESMDAVINDLGDATGIAVVQSEKVSPVMADPDASISITAYNARRIDLEVSRRNPGFLVLGEIYYPAGWKAFLNDAEVPIHRTNYVLRGVEIPAGDHRLSFRFEPDWYRSARTASNLANIFILLLVFGLTGYHYRNAFASKSHENG